MSRYRFVDWATQGFLGVVAVFIVVFRRNAPGWWPWLVVGHGVVMLAIHSLVTFRGQASVSTAWSLLRLGYPILLYTFFYRETEFMNELVGVPRLDPFFIRIEDRLFGTQPSVALMQAAPFWWVSEVLYFAYFTFYLMIAGLGVWLFTRRRELLGHFVTVVSFVFYVCYLTYMFVPVVGPRLLFRETPERDLYETLYPGAPLPSLPASVEGWPFQKLMAFIYRNFEAGSAAFPSSHVAVALTTLWFTWRYVRPLRWVHAVLAALLCVSTVYCGYHYAVDVPAGMLMALVLIPIAEAGYRRWDLRSVAQAGRS